MVLMAGLSAAAGLTRSVTPKRAADKRRKAITFTPALALILNFRAIAPTASWSGGSFDRQTCGLPFGIAILEPADEIASRAKCCDRLEGENAIGTAAIRDDLAVRRELSEAILQFA